MKIKRLEISGFKSFPKRVSLAFPKGISVIVGPNGSGKSNIVDAIRWVLGEQNPRRLRVREMADLIFANQNKGGPNFAEVRLVLENEEGNAPKELAHLSEIVIARRLYRHGEAEYFLNNRPCRLKDIIYLFLDTGVHPKAYGIIDQGQVGQFVERSPEERRSFLEELAGISRYKMRREETVRRLSRTRENLTRLKDILLEVENRQKELKLQAEEAQNYLDLQERLRRLEIQKLALLFQEALKKKSKRSERLAREKEILKGLLYRKQELDPEYNELAARLELLRQEIDKEETESRNKEKVFRQTSSEFSKLLQKETELVRSLERVETDLVYRQEKQSALKNRLKEIHLLQEETAQKLQKLGKELVVIRDQNASFDRERKELEGKLSSKKKALLEIKTKRQQLRERLNSLKETLKRALSEKEEAESKLLILTEAKKELVKEQRESLKQLSVLEKRQEVIQSKLTEHQKVLEKLFSREERVGQEITRLSLKIRELEHEMALLERFLEKEALPEAARLLKKAGFKVKTLAETLTLTPEEERLVEQALDQILTAIVAENIEQILNLAFFLQKKGVAYQIIWPKEGPQTFVMKRLAEIREVATLEEALLCKHKAFTPDGFEVDPEGLISYRPGKQQPGLLRKRRRLEEIKIQLSKTLERKNKLSSEHREIHKEISRLKELLKRDNHRLKEISKQGEDLKRKITELGFKEKSLKEKKQFFEARLYKAGKEIKSLSERRDKLEKRLEDLKKDEASLVGEIEGLGRQLLKIKDHLKESLYRERSLELELSVIKERLNQAETEKNRLLREESLFSQEIKRLSESLLEGKNRLDSLRARISQVRRTVKQLERDLDNLLKRLEEKRIVIRKLESKFIEIRRERETVLRDISRVRESLHREEVNLSEVELTIFHLQEQAMERFGIDLKEVLIEEISLEELSLEIKALKERLKNFKAINLAAIDELQRVHERHNFLLTQYKDLEEAITDLEQAVKHINQTCRKRLQDTLEEANKRLKLIFPLLLPNGEAKLRFVYSEDPLEAGLDLEVKLPGKPIRHLAMLSGGEKALTALGVLCAFYLVKPGPFCVLDEVDASLDEASTQRFRELLKELERYSQIILVTHNKQIMEAADALFGVTMEEKGVSKVVSVRLTN